jgi:glycosyltransferase involved in cell wall biosynthesis
MGSLCLITPPHVASETFIRAHERELNGPKVILTGTFPDYSDGQHVIRYFYNQHKNARRFLKLLPYWYYERNKSKLEPEDKAVNGFLTEFFQRHQVNVILAEYGFTGADITPIAKKLQIPLVVHFHGHDAYHVKYLKDYESRFQEMFAYATYFISVSNAMTGQLERLGAPRDRIVCNPCAPRDYFYEVKPNYTNILIAVGRFAETKAPHLTISAFKMLCDEMPDARLVMVGEGPLRESCMSLAEGLGISGNIDFPGALDHSQTRNLMAAACCFVQHSITTSENVREGTPVAILEAGAAGLPVIATRHAGIKEAVIHGETGFLVEEKNVFGMKTYMKTLLLDKGACRTMGEKARAHVRKNYSFERHIRSIQELVDKASKHKS